jgi:CRISPR-associated endonuclease/helicase Cas3
VGRGSFWHDAIVWAAGLHDVGKSHSVFKVALDRVRERTPEGASWPDPPWAKSGSDEPLHYERRFFRHELASALALLDRPVAGSLPTNRGGLWWDLVVYLVAAHHGRVRLGFRSLPGEREELEESGGSTLAGRVALGVRDEDRLPEVATPFGMLAPVTLRLDAMELGGGSSGRPSWSERMLRLRDDPEIGPFRLGLAEALVRLADWRASEDECQGVRADGEGRAP